MQVTAEVSRARMLCVLRDNSLCISNVFISRVNFYMTVYRVF